LFSKIHNLTQNFLKNAKNAKRFKITFKYQLQKPLGDIQKEGGKNDSVSHATTLSVSEGILRLCLKDDGLAPHGVTFGMTDRH
jgi:hypothetical protein